MEKATYRTRAINLRRSIRISRRVGNLISRTQSSQQRPRSSKSGWNLHKYGRQQSRSSETMTHSRVQVPKDANGQSSQRIRYLWRRRELPGTEEVHDVARERNEEHDWRLFPLGLVDDRQAERERGDEEPFPIVFDGIGAMGITRRVFVHETVESCANSDTVS